MLQLYPVYLLWNRCKTITESPDPTCANSTNKPCMVISKLLKIADNTTANICKKTTLIFISRKHTILRMNWLDLLSIPCYIQLSKVLLCSKEWSLLIYAFHILQLNAFQKVSLCILWKMVLLVCNFQNGGKFRTLQTVSIYFLLIYHHFIMLKTNTMLDYW